MIKTCYYCNRESTCSINVKGGEVALCECHSRVLKTPSLAIPFLKGWIINKNRGNMEPRLLSYLVEELIKQMKEFKPQKPA